MLVQTYELPVAAAEVVKMRYQHSVKPNTIMHNRNISLKTKTIHI